MSDKKLMLATIVSVPFEENTYVAWLDGSSECILVDPGLQPGKIVAELAARELTPRALLITHGHSDHIGGNAALKQRWPQIPIVIGKNDAAKLTDPMQNLSGPAGLPMVSPPADLLLDDGDVYEAAGMTFSVREIPGHSRGHVVFVWKEGSPIVVFGGDVLFAGSIGRTDFPDGDFQQLERGIKEKLYTLPDNTIVLPGHGPATTIGEERRTNPFVRG